MKLEVVIEEMLGVAVARMDSPETKANSGVKDKQFLCRVFLAGTFLTESYPLSMIVENSSDVRMFSFCFMASVWNPYRQ